MKLLTTLAIIRAARPCAEGYAKLLRHLGPDWPEDRQIDFETILKSNGLDDALWGLRCVLPEQDAARNRAAREFACDCAEAVLPIFERVWPEDKRPRHAIDVARRFANGSASASELAAARDAAWDAARDAAWAAAGAAAGDAARDVERKWQTSRLLKYLNGKIKPEIPK